MDEPETTDSAGDLIRLWRAHEDRNSETLFDLGIRVGALETAVRILLHAETIRRPYLKEDVLRLNDEELGRMSQQPMSKLGAEGFARSRAALRALFMEGLVTTTTPDGTKAPQAPGDSHPASRGWLAKLFGGRSG